MHNVCGLESVIEGLRRSRHTDRATGPLRVDANPSHHIAHLTTESASLLRYWKILATLLASTAPHPIAVIPILGASEIGLEGANWTDSGNLAGWNADASREDRKLELFGTLYQKTR